MCSLIMQQSAVMVPKILSHFSDANLLKLLVEVPLASPHLFSLCKWGCDEVVQWWRKMLLLSRALLSILGSFGAFFSLRKCPLCSLPWAVALRARHVSSAHSSLLTNAFFLWQPHPLHGHTIAPTSRAVAVVACGVLPACGAAHFAHRAVRPGASQLPSPGLLPASRLQPKAVRKELLSAHSPQQRDAASWAMYQPLEVEI